MSSRPLTRPASGLAGTLVALIAGAGHAQSSIDVDLQDGLLTLRTSSAPAEQLAEALRDATGISFVITGEPSTPLSADFADEPLDKAIALLAPNHMLVREDAQPDAAIIEVVMMMPDSPEGSSDSTEFLPSGAPADELFNAEPGGLQDVEYDENGLPVDPAELRDPGRTEMAREVAEFPDGSVDENGLPVDDGSGFDPEPQIDPATGEIIQQ